MKQFDYTVRDSDGLHARPAGKFVKFAQGCSSGVSISLRGQTANAKRLFAVLSLGVKRGDDITVRVEGENEASDCEKLEAFCRESI